MVQGRSGLTIVRYSVLEGFDLSVWLLVIW